MKADLDKKLILLYKKGDKKALEKIYLKYKNSLLNLIFFYINNKEDTEDVFQTVFEKLIKKIGKYKPKKNSTFKTYLFQIAINTCKDFLRKKKILNFLKREILYKEEKTIQKIEDDINLEYVRRCVYELPEKYKEVIILIYYQNLKYEEVAKILKKPIGTIKSRVNYALNLLRKKIGGEKNG